MSSAAATSDLAWIDCPIFLRPTRLLYPVAIHSLRRSRGRRSDARLLEALVMDVLDIEGVDVAGNIAQDGEQDVDTQVRAAACNAPDADRWDLMIISVVSLTMWRKCSAPTRQG